MNDIFENINKWLIYAETKNGVLVGVNSALFIALINILLEKSFDNLWLQIYIIEAVILLGLSTLISILSFFPMTNIPWLLKEKDIDENDNILYFGHIKNYSVNDFLNSLLMSKQVKIDKDDLLTKHYAQQIITNSKITYRKLKFFRAALWLLLSALLTPIIGLLVIIVTIEEMD